jgi:prepilin signal peptidase PulO-like enzyme (type II secretory pathway)
VIFFLYNTRIAKKNKLPEKDERERTNFIIGYFTLLAIVPNLLLTDTEHFLFSLPLIILLLNYLSITKNYFEIGAFVLIIFLYAGNSVDLLGHKLSDQLDKMGTLGISNLLIIGYIVYVTFQNKKNQTFTKMHLNKHTPPS